MKNKRYKIIIIEPSELITQGLKSIISMNASYECVADFQSIGKALEKMHLHKADIILINPQLTIYQKKNLLKEFGDDIKIGAILYTYIDKDYLSKYKEIIEIYDSQANIISKLNNLIKSDIVNTDATETEDLSAREKEILIAVSKGLTNKEIAAEYNISIHTVISHRKNISKKTGIKSASGFGVYALLNNLIS